jgi:hypothetical protein
MKTIHVGLNFTGKTEFIDLTQKTKYKINEEKINLAWKGVTGEQYFVQILDVKNKQVILKKQTTETHISLLLESIGAYIFEVMSMDYPTLEKAEFSYDVSAPILIWDSRLQTEIKSAEQDEEIPLRYKENLNFGNNASLHVRYSPMKAPPIAKTIKLRNDLKIKLFGFGQYCFTGKLNTPVEYFLDSDDYCIKLIQIPVFAPLPKAKNAVLSTLKKDGIISYKLKVPRVNKATKYLFEVYGDGQGKKLVYSKNSSTPECIIRSNQSGVYYFRYKVYDSKNRESNFSTLSKFIFPISPLSDWQNEE